MNEPKTKKLMTTGVFAKRTRLSHKALRLYDSMGLLEPSFVDEQSKYRYYHDNQIEKAKLIALLRQLEMPLTNIASILNLEGQHATKAIAEYWQEVEKDILTKRKLVHYLKSYLAGKGESMFEVLDRNVEEQKILTLEKRLFQPELNSFIQTSSHDLHQYISQSKQTPSPQLMVIYHGKVTTDSDGPIEVCIPFTGSLEPQGKKRIRLEPAHREAYVRLTKTQVAFPEILEAYDAVGKYLNDAGRTITASPREIYFADWANLSDDDPACDVAFPYV